MRSIWHGNSSWQQRVMKHAYQPLAPPLLHGNGSHTQIRPVQHTLWNFNKWQAGGWWTFKNSRNQITCLPFCYLQTLSTMKWAASKTAAICLQGKIWYIIWARYSPVYGSSDPVFFCEFIVLFLMEKIWYGNFPGLKHPRWLFGISCVDSITVSLSPSIFIAMKAWPCLASLKGKASELHGLAHGCLSELYGGRTTF